MILKILSITWQLPQNILGYLLFLIMHKHRITGTRWSVKTNFNFDFCLGVFCFYGKYFYKQLTSYVNGYKKYSLLTGPLYLFVIFIPSIIWNTLIWKQTNLPKSWFYTEKRNT